MGKLLTLKESAERLNRSENTIRYWIARDEFAPSFRLGRRRMVREEDLEAWLRQKELSGHAEAVPA